MYISGDDVLRSYDVFNGRGDAVRVLYLGYVVGVYFG